MFSGCSEGGIDQWCPRRGIQCDYEHELSAYNRAGDTTQVNFGAQKQAAFEDTGTTVEGTRRSPGMAVLGIGLIVAGAVIVIILLES